jgi:hypothetical protein
MTLDIQDFVGQANGNVAVEDIPPAVRKRVNGALEDLTGEEGGPAGPAGDLYDAVVAKDESGDYTSIQTAVDNVSSGAVISVEAGRYDEQVSIDKSDITIFGAGQGETIIDAAEGETGTNRARVTIEASGVTIRELTVTNAGASASSDEVQGIFVGDPDGTDDITDTAITQVEITDIDGGGAEKSTEGIHAKTYNEGAAVDGLNISGVTIAGISKSTWGANGIKIQAGVNNVTISDSTVKNVSGLWAYGVVLTPSSNEAGVPQDVRLENSSIEDVSAREYTGVGIGIDSTSGNPATSAANPDELSFDDNVLIRDATIGILDKNTEVTASFDPRPTFRNVETPTSDPSPDPDA